MRPRRLALALVSAAAVILSAPVAQQLFTYASEEWGRRSRTAGLAATLVPVAVAMGWAITRIRDRRRPRYLALASSITLGSGYAAVGGLTFTEAFHFVEYGLLAWLFYRAQEQRGDTSPWIVALLACAMVGTLDEGFQWFVPIRTGELRDVQLDLAAGVCGLLFAFAIEPPGRVTMAMAPASGRSVGAYAAATLIVVALFVAAVQTGHVVRDGEVGEFQSRYSAAALMAMAADRAERWSTDPPVALRRFSREDQYLAEGIWRVRRRNQAWETGDRTAARRENRILEKYYAPVLDAPSYLGPSGHRWPAEQRAAAEAELDRELSPVAGDDYPYPLLIWPFGA